MDKAFKIKYSKDYRDDLKSTVKYIRTNLQNPIAAQNLKSDVIEKVPLRLIHGNSCVA